MQKTANEIKSSFELLASGHYQIHSFLYAQEFEQQAYENLIYPLMLVYPLGGSLSGTSYTRNYRVVIADRVLKSEGNELEVESDTQLIALDTLAYWMKLGTNERFSITSSNTITPFWEKWGDEVTGHFVDIGIEEFYDFNSCAIPLSSAIPSPTNPCKDARILINSVIYGNAPSDTNFNVVVKDQLGALVGSLIGGEWIVNCADASYTIEDSLGNVLYTGTIPSGGSVNEVIGNSTLNVNKSDGTLISSRSILAEATDSYNVADSVAVIKDSLGTTLKSENILATASENITINDSVAVIKDSANLTLKSENILAQATENIVINDSSVNVNKSDGTLISAVSVKAENTTSYNVGDSNVTNSDSSYDVDVKATESLSLPDSQINVNSVDSGDVVSVKTIDVNLEDSVGDPVTPTSVGLVGNTLTIEVSTGSSPSGVLFKETDANGQRTQYDTTGIDAGALAQSGWFSSIVKPPNPKVIAQLDYTLSNYHFRLKDPLVVNGVSSTNRFVDVNGIQAFSSTSNADKVLIDKLTGLMWYRHELAGTMSSFGTSKLWQAGLDDIAAHSIVIKGITYDDWVAPTINQWGGILLNYTSGGLDLKDGTIDLMRINSMITGNTSESNTAQAYRVIFNVIQIQGKTGTAFRVYAVRKAHDLITAP